MNLGAIFHTKPRRDSLTGQVEASVFPPRLWSRVRNNNRKAHDGDIEAHETVESTPSYRSEMAARSAGMGGQEKWAHLPAHSYFMGERLPPSSPPSENDSDTDSIFENW
ncbi:hypothetical protein H0H93_009905 [Arthromyces matolae]|nr:hypothetical protein H0H93_009905 [Arthromyces matolae]